MNAPLQPVFGKVDAIRKEVIAAASLPLNRATTLPRHAYIDEDYFRFESESVLKTGWLCLAHLSQVKEPGDFLALDLLGEPLLILRDKGGTVRVLSRVCVHRAMDIMPDGFDFPRSGKTALLSCPYHRWTYNLDGSVRGCAQMQGAEGFDKKEWGLAELRAEIWNGFVFVNFDGAAPQLNELYADFGKCIAPWHAEDMEIAIAMEWECDFNWKVMIENWMESYHHLGAHSATLNPFMPGERTWTETEHPHFVHAHLPFTDAYTKTVGEGCSFQPIQGLSKNEQSEWGLYLGYPCFMFLTMPDRVLWYRLLPISAGRCKLLTTTLVARENLGASDLTEKIASETKLMRDFHLEDMMVNSAVQRGLGSSKVVRGRLSHLEEPVWLIQRYLAARAEGRYPETATV
ncbi:MAG TPA: aromatic ring-hydroxylating dioxygenase subunit alpha [Micropepsaceae bacterium]|nr:aromatic ring-hydroxylating dioxygenase subunit alpha [Micropepsaceae bacterium]